MNITKVTPVRIVNRIEPCLPFWCDALGYEKRAEVPHEGALGFVLLENGGGEIMFQSRASLEADMPAVAKLSPHTVLFIEVKSLTEAIEAAKGSEVLVKERTTFYGMRESWSPTHGDNRGVRQEIVGGTGFHRPRGSGRGGGGESTRSVGPVSTGEGGSRGA